MANSNFVVQNGLTAGSATIDSTSGNIATSGNVSATGSLTTGTSLTFNTFSIYESGSKLYFKTGSTVLASLDTTGNLTLLADVKAFTTP